MCKRNELIFMSSLAMEVRFYSLFHYVFVTDMIFKHKFI